MSGPRRTPDPVTPKIITIGLGHIAAAVLLLAVLIWLAVHALTPSPLAGDHCPAPDFAVMTPTGPGCAESLHIGVATR